MKYIAPEMEMVIVETEDVILASSGKGELPEDEF